jgi:hypothetical protein
MRYRERAAMMRTNTAALAPMPAFAPVLRLGGDEADAGLEADDVATFARIEVLVTVNVTSAFIGFENPRPNVFAGPIVDIMVKLPPTAWCAVCAESSWIQN